MHTRLARVATTHVDAHGEQADAAALAGMAQAINQSYLPFRVNDDPRIAPIGRIAGAMVQHLPDGHLAVVALIEVWDVGDTRESITGDDRRPPPPTDPEHRFRIGYDRAAAAELGEELFAELAALAGPSAEPQYHAKTSDDAISAVMIGGGVFATDGIAGGFRQRLGEDLYTALQERLAKVARPRSSGDRVLVLQFGVEHGAELVAVDLIATNPTPTDVRALFSTGLPALDTLVTETVRANPDAATIVAHLDGTGVRLLHWIRADGVPSVLRPIDPAILSERSVLVGRVARPAPSAGDV